MKKRIISAFVVAALLCSLEIPAGAAKIEEAQTFALYEEAVSDINEQYNTQITLYSIPESMSVTEFQTMLANMAISNAKAKASIERAKTLNTAVENAAAHTTADTETVNIGRSGDDWVVLICKDVIIGPSDYGTKFYSASSSNVTSKAAHPALSPCSYEMTDKYALICDAGASLEIGATGTLTAHSSSGIDYFQWPDYSTSVVCSTSDTVNIYF